MAGRYRYEAFGPNLDRSTKFWDTATLFKANSLFWFVLWPNSQRPLSLRPLNWLILINIRYRHSVFQLHFQSKKRVEKTLKFAIFNIQVEFRGSSWNISDCALLCRFNMKGQDQKTLKTVNINFVVICSWPFMIVPLPCLAQCLKIQKWQVNFWRVSQQTIHTIPGFNQK